MIDRTIYEKKFYSLIKIDLSNHKFAFDKKTVNFTKFLPIK